MTTTIRPLYRLCHPDWAASAFSGAGSAMYPGRWNNLNHKCVYAAASVALALCEQAVHFDDTPPDLYKVFRVDVPESLITYPDTLPSGWAADGVVQVARDFGSAWLASGVSLALALPSKVVPHEMNFLLNPAHLAFASLVISPQPDLVLDARFPVAQRPAPVPTKKARGGVVRQRKQ